MYHGIFSDVVVSATDLSYVPDVLPEVHQQHTGPDGCHAYRPVINILVFGETYRK